MQVTFDAIVRVVCMACVALTIAQHFRCRPWLPVMAPMPSDEVTTNVRHIVAFGVNGKISAGEIM